MEKTILNGSREEVRFTKHLTRNQKFERRDVSSPPQHRLRSNTDLRKGLVINGRASRKKKKKKKLLTNPGVET